MRSAQVPRWVWLVLVGAHVVALGWVVRTGNWAFPDSGRYLQAASNLRLHGELYARPWPRKQPWGQDVQEFTIRSVGYPALVSALGATANRPMLLLMVQNLLSLLNIGTVLGWWARRAQPRGKDWAVALMAVLSFPAQFVYANAVMSEMALQTAVLAIVGFGLCFIENQGKRWFTGVAGAVTLAFLLKPVFYPFAIAIAGMGVGIAVWCRRVSLAVIGLAPVLVAVLYMGWNEHRTGYFHFSSIAEINLLHYNAAGVVRQVEGPVAEARWVAGVLRKANVQPDFAARQRLIQAQASAVLWAHPGVYARQHLAGMAALLLDPGRFDLGQFLRLDPPEGGGLLAQARAGGLWQALMHLPLGLLGGLGLILLANAARLVLAARGFRRLRNGGPMLRYGRWVVVGLLLYVALLTGPLGAARFLVPVWPLLLALTLVGWRWDNELPASHAQQPPPVREDEREGGAKDGSGEVAHAA